MESLTVYKMRRVAQVGVCIRTISELSRQSTNNLEANSNPLNLGRFRPSLSNNVCHRRVNSNQPVGQTSTNAQSKTSVPGDATTKKLAGATPRSFRAHRACFYFESPFSINTEKCANANHTDCLAGLGESATGTRTDPPPEAVDNPAGYPR